MEQRRVSLMYLGRLLDGKAGLVLEAELRHCVGDDVVQAPV